MERREFFKGLIASALAVTIAPALLNPAIEKDTRKSVYAFKVSGELLKEPNAAEYIESEVNRIAKKHKDRKVGDIELGYAGGDEFQKPDFLMNLRTVRFELLPV